MELGARIWTRGRRKSILSRGSSESKGLGMGIFCYLEPKPSQLLHFCLCATTQMAPLYLHTQTPAHPSKPSSNRSPPTCSDEPQLFPCGLQHCVLTPSQDFSHSISCFPASAVLTPLPLCYVLQEESSPAGCRLLGGLASSWVWSMGGTGGRLEGRKKGEERLGRFSLSALNNISSSGSASSISPAHL